ncbi:MAG TPA: hypothetical protein DCM08_03605 [Microscillaceae bacterium]|jgi:pimeloyl-ACP methyl ester carboxylesterase|nr:hypothetical protein [Microscillaceae bacterium]
MQKVKKILKYFAISLLVLVVVFSLLPYLIPLHSFPAFDAKQPFANSQFVQIDGFKLHYRLSKPTSSPQGKVLLVHGFSGSTFSWRYTMDSLAAAGYWVVAVDLPAFGYSDRNPSFNHANTSRATLLWHLLEKIAPSSDSLTWALAGHSMGAGVVMAMAALHPEKTHRLILVDGAGGNRSARGVSVRQWLMQTLLSYPPVVRWVEVIAEYRFYHLAYFTDLLTSAYSKRPTPSDAQGYLNPFLLQGTTRAVLRMMQGNNPEVAQIDMRQIKTPISLIWGEDDRWVNIQAGKRMKELYPEANFWTIPSAGHCPMETHPATFNQLFKKALK